MMMDIESAKATLGEGFSFFCEYVQEQLDYLKLAPEARILDVGTGMGRLAITLALSGYRVLTGEPADDGSEYAKQAWLADARKVGADEAITFQPFDAQALPFGDATFDAIFMMGALHHMGDPGAAVQECIRALAPAGVLCIMEPTAALVERARAKFPDHPDPADPAPLAAGMALLTTHGEMFDTHLIRHLAHR